MGGRTAPEGGGTELLEAFESSLRTFQLYEDGYARLVMRLPKVFDVMLSFRVPPDETDAGEPNQAGD